ncbi:MAG: hypothetical protein ACJA2O_003902 [Candidatus Azotimanducaceae bacterium]|jgi:hypothetical protein
MLRPQEMFRHSRMDEFPATTYPEGNSVSCEYTPFLNLASRWKILRRQLPALTGLLGR